jgi:hypothetical protein
MKEYFKRIKNGAKIWEICFWWIFRILMIYAFIKGLTKVPFDISDPLQIFGNFIGMFAWEIFMLCPKKTFFRQIPSYVQDVSVIMIFGASFCGKFLNLYYESRWLDSGLHLVSGGLCVILGYEIMTAMQKRDKKTVSLPIIILGALSFSFFVSTCWELFEFTADQIMCMKGTIGDAQHWCYELAQGTPKEATIFDPVYHERWSLMDTMDDIILNTVGAIVAWIGLKIYPYHHKGKNDVNKQIEVDLISQFNESKDSELISK